MPFPREKQSKRIKIQVEVSIPMETVELEGEYALVAPRCPWPCRPGYPPLQELNAGGAARSHASTRRSALPVTLTPEQETNYWDLPSWTWVLPDPSRSSECSQVRSGQW